MPQSRKTIELARRDFLRACLIAAGGVALGSCGESGSSRTRATAATVVAPTGRTKGVVIATGNFPDQHGNVYHTLATLDLDSPGPNAVRSMRLPFFPHGVAVDPNAPDHVVLFEKKGKGSCRVDLGTMNVTRKIETVTGREFYGHGVYASDGSVYYCTETDLRHDFKGLVVIRDAKDHRILGEFPTYGTEPHDCRLTADGKTLVITNGGDPPEGEKPPSVTYVDVASQKLVDELHFSTPRINAGHLALTPDGDLAVVSAPRKGMTFERDVSDLGGISFRAAGGSFTTIEQPRDVVKKLLRESLSVAIHAETGTVGVTNPDAGLVTFWNLRDGRHLETLAFRRPHGIALPLDDSEFLVTHGGGKELAHIEPRSLKVTRTTKSELPLLSGSHIVVHDLPRS